MLPALLSLLVAGAPGPAPAAAASAADARVAVLAAMSAELSRSTERLRLQGYEAPYFVSYQVKDVTRHDLGGRYGAIFEDATRRDRNLSVDLRVGSYELDSSGGDETALLLGAEGPTWYAPKDAPLDGDVAARRTGSSSRTDATSTRGPRRSSPRPRRSGPPPSRSSPSSRRSAARRPSIRTPGRRSSSRRRPGSSSTRRWGTGSRESGSRTTRTARRSRGRSGSSCSRPSSRSWTTRRSRRRTAWR